MVRTWYRVFVLRELFLALYKSFPKLFFMSAIAEFPEFPLLRGFLHC